MPALAGSPTPPITRARTTTSEKRTSDGYVRRFGMIRYRRSIRAIPGIRARSPPTSPACHGFGYRIAARTTRAAVVSSSRGYSTEMRSPHRRHRPRSNSHESTGMLSRAPISAPHAGHLDRGRMTDSPLGSR